MGPPQRITTLLLWIIGLYLILSTNLRAADCNGNSVEDRADIASGKSSDCNQNGIPDECDVAQTASFLVPQNFDLGFFPHTVSGGDLDGDRDADLVLADLRAESLWLVSNPGTGAFEAPVKLTLKARALSSTLADMDGDHDLDIVATLASDEVELLRNLGDSSFTPWRAVPAGREPVSAVALDMDGDGDLDLVSVNRAGGDLSVLRNDGGGEFSSLGSLPAGTSPSSAAAADFNGDGALDLAIASEGSCCPYFDGVATIFFNSGAGAFKAAVSLPAGIHPSSIVSADLNGDGDPDLALASAGDRTRKGSLSVIINRKGSLDPPQDLAAGPNPRQVSAADFDGDGDLDLAAANFDDLNASHTVSIFFNEGGTFRDMASYVSGTRAELLFSSDLNGDGSMDLLVGSATSREASLLWNRGKGALAAPRVLLAGDKPSSALVADFNSDGLPDIVVGTQGFLFDNGVIFYFGKEGGAFTAEPVLEAAGDPTSLAAADLDGDGKLDLAVAGSEATTLHVFWNEGNARFKRLFFLDVLNPFFVAPGDLDGDGDIDLVTSSFLPVELKQTVAVFWSKGKRLFANPDLHPVELAPRSLAVADFDLDGDLDIAVTGAFWTTGNTNLLAVLTNEGNGALSKPEYFFAGERLLSMAAADLDADGDTDLVTADHPSDAVLLLENDGRGQFSRSGAIAVGANPISVVARDLDGDGLVDLAAANRLSDDISLVLSGGRRGFLVPRRLRVDANPLFLAAADLDGDGQPDFITVHREPGSLSLISGQTNLPSGMDKNQNGIPDECGDLNPRDFRRGDANQDGKVNLADAIFLLESLFQKGEAPACRKAADSNDDSRLNIADPVTLIRHLFQGLARLPEPFDRCGPDPTEDGLTCQRFAPCEG